jgi:hypothetical protein
MELAAASPSRLHEMGAAGRDYYFRELSLEAGASRFEQIFARVLQGDRG